MAEWAEKNRSYFNEAASTYNSKFSKTILQLIDEIQARRDWIGVDWVEDYEDDDDNDDGDEEKDSPPKSQSQKTVRLLDYACGTGLVSRALAPYVTQSLGIDLSPSMVSEYNTGASNQGIPEDEMHAVVGNLIEPSPASPSPSPPSSSSDAAPSDAVAATAPFSTPEWHNFDIAAVGMGWHHFADPRFAATQLARRLRVGGVLLIIDFLPHEGFGNSHSHAHKHGHGHGHSHGHAHAHTKPEQQQSATENTAAHTVTHMGFAEADIKSMFEEAGVGKNFKHVVLGKGVVFESEGRSLGRTVFMARGVKG